MTEQSDGGREITRLETQQRHPQRLNLYLDGEFAFGLTLEIAERESLRVGDRLSPERIEQLQSLDDQSKAVDSGLRLLTTRPRSEREVRDRLRRKGFPAEIIDAAIERLEGWHYLDDEAFARFWIENRETNRPRGRRLLEQELRLKGVDRVTIRQTIDESEIDEFNTALEVGRKKLRSYERLDPALGRRRMMAFLSRRGYSFAVIKPAIEQLFGESDELEGVEE
jgi:regulatory protein